MGRFLAMAMLGSLALAAPSFANACSQQLPDAASTPAPDNASTGLPSLPPVPRGISTILGGQIRNVNPVLDQFALHIYGERPMNILYDERTQVFRNGVRIPLSELGSEDHASVQTILDGDKVFAISIHILSSPQGNCQGLVLSYNPATGRLSVDSALSPQPIELFVPSDTPVVRTGEPTFIAGHSGLSDLVRGSLVSVTFAPGARRRGVVQHITILAIPGAKFIFGGDITYLDLNAGALVLHNPQDGNSYQISFDPGRFTASQNLHPGENVTVTASYDGRRYVASEITVN